MTVDRLAARKQPAAAALQRLFAAYGQESSCSPPIVVLFVVVGAGQSALPRRHQPDQHLLRQRLYRGRRDRHVDGHHLRPYRRLGRLADRRARHDLPARWRSRAIRSGSPGSCRSWSASPSMPGVGVLVAYTRIPSIVVTLGMLSILKGGLISVTGGTWITDMPPDFLHRPDAAVRHSGAGLFHGRPDRPRGAVDALFGVRPLDLCGRRQSGGGARRRISIPSARCVAGLRHARLLRRHRGASCSPRSCRSSSRPCRPISN